MKRFSGLELRRVSINTVIQFIVRITGSIATLTTTLFIAYFLGLESVGSFTKVVAFVSAFYLLVDFGFNSVLLRHYFKDVEKYIGNLVVLRLGIAFFLLPVIILLGMALPHNELAGTGFSNAEKTAISIYSLTLIGVALNNCMTAFMQKNLVYKASLLPSFVSGIFLITLVAYASFTKSFYFLFTSYVLYWGLFSFLMYIVLRKSNNLRLNTTKVFSFSKTLLWYSWPLGLMLFFNFLYSRADILLLSYFKPSTDVGVYGISYRFFEVAVALPTFLANSTYPLLLKQMNNNNSYLQLFKKYFVLYSILSFFILTVVFLGAPLVGFLNEDFSQSRLPLQLLSLSLPFFFLTSLLQWHFLIRNKLVFLIPLYGGVLVLNVILNMLFIPTFSYNASAVITGVSEGIVFLIMLFYFLKTSSPAKN